MGNDRAGNATAPRTGLRMIRGLVRLFGANASGQSGVEYGVVAAVIGLAVAGSGGDLKAALQATLRAVSSNVERATAGPGAPIWAGGSVAPPKAPAVPAPPP